MMNTTNIQNDNDLPSSIFHRVRETEMSALVLDQPKDFKKQLGSVRDYSPESVHESPFLERDHIDVVPGLHVPSIAMASDVNSKVNCTRFTPRWNPHLLDSKCHPDFDLFGTLPFKALSESLHAEAGGFLDDVRAARQSINTISESIEQVHLFLSKVKATIQYPSQDDFCESLISRLESLMLLVLDLSGRKRLRDMVIPVVQYIKTWMGGKSITTKLISWATTILTEDANGNLDDGEFVDAQGFVPNAGWFSSNWMQLTQGHFGKKLASVINLLIIGGMLPEKAESALTQEAYKILNVSLSRKHQPSIFHHLFTTLDWVADSVIPAFVSGNMALLISDSDVDEIDTLYRTCIDVVNLNITGQMKLAKEKYGVIDEASILMMLTNTSIAIQTMKAQCRDDAMMTREYNLRLIRLDKLSTDMQAFWHESALRTKPFAVLIRGGSSVGKSVISNLICHVISKANGLPEGKEYWCTINGNDKYQSDFRSQHICVMFDDMGNTKPEKCEGNPLFVLIQFINNMHCSALSPEADKKGKMDIRCRIVVVTTNTDQLHASLFSVNPASIMRRFDAVLDVSLKDGASDANGGLASKFAGNPMPDAWNIRCGTVKITRSLVDSLADNWRVVNIPDVSDIVDLVRYLELVTPMFYATQEKIVAASSDMHLKEHCSLHSLFCLPCPACAKLEYLELKDHDDASIQTEFGDCSPFVHSVLKPETGPYESRVPYIGRFPENDPLSFVERLAERVKKEPMPMMLEPTEVLTPSCEEDEFVESNLSPRMRIDALLGATTARARDLLNAMRKKCERDPWTTALATIAGLGLAGLAVHALVQPQSLKREGAVYSRIEMAAQSPRQLVERDERYKKVYSNVAVFPEASKTCTLAQIEAKVDRNLHFVRMTEFDVINNVPIGDATWCNTFPVGGAEWIFVGHQFLHGKTYLAEMMTHPDNGIKRFKAMIDDSNVRPIFGTDAVVVDMPTGGDNTDFKKYMCQKTIAEADLKPGTPITVYHVHKSVLDEGETYVPPSMYKLCTKIKEIKRIKVDGVGMYDSIVYEAQTHQGMCGSMVFTAGRNPILIGMHSAGDAGVGIGAAVPLTAESVMETHAMKNGAIRVAETEALREEIYGVNVKLTPDAHAFNPVHYLESEVNMEVHGETSLPRARFATEIGPSAIAERFKEISGVVDKHVGPPKSGIRPSRYRHLQRTAELLPPANPTFLAMAVQDFKDKLKRSVFKDGSSFKEYVHPLNYEDALNGSEGVRGFDPINPKTSMSFPLSGAKHKYFAENELKHELGLQTHKFVKKIENEDGTVRYVYELEFDPLKADVRTEVENILEWFYEGKRVNVVFRTNLKDEPISYEKASENKIRIFAGAPVALVIVSRMMTLPLINAMSYYPAEFESAVGVDAAGKDWQFIADYLSKKSGGTRCGDGDFSGYDNRMRPEFTRAAFEMLKWCLLEAGVEPDLLKVVDGLATECVYPLYDIDGLIVKTFGSNPSGHPLTVIINGLDNSLYMRYAYYSMHYCDAGKLSYGDIPLFHEMVSLITYGDDNNFDVRPEEPLFNMISVGVELAKIGHAYTDSSKQISTVPFKSLDEISFLKRKYHLHPQLGKRVGALEFDSIHKSLLLCRQSRKGATESMAQICAGNMAAALYEVYLHSEEEYWKYAKMFESLRSVTDAEGFEVGAYYDPPSIETIHSRYEDSKCCYDDAQLLLENFRPESGVLDQMDIDYEVVQAPLVVQDYLDYYAAIFREVFPDEQELDVVPISVEYCTVTMIKFKFFIDEVEPDLYLFGSDYRLDSTFLVDIGNVLDDFNEKKEDKKYYCAHLDYIFDNVDGPLVVVGSNAVKGVEMLRRIRRRNVELPAILLPEIQDLIWDFLHPPLVEGALSDRGIVMVTPDILERPHELIYRTSLQADLLEV